MHLHQSFYAILLLAATAQCGPAMKVESVIKTSTGLPIARSLDSDYAMVPILVPDLTSDYLVVGELMPFWPLDGCSDLQVSQYTTARGGKVRFNPAVPGSRVITIMQAGNCSYETKMTMADQADNVDGVLILGENDELPPKIDLYFYNTNLSSYLIKQSTGSSLIQIADWHRSHKIRSDAANLANLTLPLISKTGQVFLPPDTSDLTPLATLASPSGHRAYYDSWLSATLYYTRPDAEGSMFGLVEFSLILVVVLLTVAFLTSIVLHCYFYRLRVRRARLAEHGSAGHEELGQGGRQLLVAEHLSFLPKSAYLEFHQARIKLNEKLAANSKASAARDAQALDVHNKPEAASSSTAADGTMPKSLSATKAPHLPASLAARAVALHGSDASSAQLLIPLNDTCPICLEEFESAEELRQLPCHHLYHPSCIDDWLTTKSAKCPMCKFDVYGAIKRMEEAKAQAQNGATSPAVLSHARNRMEKMMAWLRPKWWRRARADSSLSSLSLSREQLATSEQNHGVSS